MPEKEVIVKGIELRWTGVADASELYETLKDWLNMMGFGDEKKNFIETLYKEQIQGDAKRIDIEWSSEKEIDPYVNFMINVKFQMVGIKDAEIKQGDRTIHTNKGDFRVWLDGILVKDPKDKWGPLMKGIYERFIIRSRLDNYREDLYTLVYSLQKTIKGVLNLREP